MFYTWVKSLETPPKAPTRNPDVEMADKDSIKLREPSRVTGEAEEKI